MPLHRRLPLTLEEEHGQIEDYPVDGVNNVEDFYVFKNPQGYSPKKIDILMGRNRMGNALWTEKEIEHVKNHIAERLGPEQEKKEREEAHFDKITEIPPEYAIALVTIRGQRYKFARNPETGRFAKILKEEKNE